MVFGLGKFFKREVTPSFVPADRRVYAIGDIHGRVDLLDALHARIAEDAQDHPDDTKVIVYLGDYIDRGLDSKAVIDRLIDKPLDGFEHYCLMGNHEAVMLQFLEEPAIGSDWVEFGGRSTLLSYGVGLKGTSSDAFVEAQENLIAALPPAHGKFLQDLALTHTEGDYFFVHAGIRPGVPIENQRERDLLWIREPFLSSRAWHEKVVVHGHTIRGTPEVTDRRIGIDTAAYATGVLTCLVLSGSDRTFLTVE